MAARVSKFGGLHTSHLSKTSLWGGSAIEPPKALSIGRPPRRRSEEVHLFRLPISGFVVAATSVMHPLTGSEVESSWSLLQTRPMGLPYMPTLTPIQPPQCKHLLCGIHKFVWECFFHQIAPLRSEIAGLLRSSSERTVHRSSSICM